MSQSYNDLHPSTASAVDPDDMTARTDNLEDAEAAESQIQSEVPDLVLRLIVGSSLLGMLVILVSFVFAASFQNLSFATGALLGGYLLVRGWMLKRHWEQGKIEELFLRCVSCQIKRNVLTVICADEENDRLLEFRAPVKRSDILPGNRLLIYRDVQNPSVILAFKTL